MNTFFEFLRKVYNGIAYVLSYDLQNFRNVFHHTYWLWFIVIRVLPWLAAVIFLTGLIKKRRNEIASLLERLKQIPEAVGSCSPKILFVIIFLAGALLRIWYAFALPLIPLEGDAISRLQQAKEWYDSYNGIPGNLVWLPLHHWIIGFGSLFGLDIFTGSRLMTLLFSLLTFPVFYRLVKRRFGSTVALISCLLLAINPFHIKYSVITMSEVPFIFFAVSALLALFRYIDSEKFFYLVISSLCLSCCSLIRFEGWILSALMPFVLLYYKRSFKSFFLYGAMNSLIILAYMAISFASTGRLIEGLTISDLTVRNAFAAKQNATAYIVQTLSSGLILPVWMFFILLYGLFIALKEKKELPWLALPVILLGMTAWKVLNHTSEPFWRYFSTGLFLILPFAAFGIARLIKLNRWIKILWLPLMLVIFSENIYSQYEAIINTRNVPDGFYETAAWFKAHYRAGQKFIYHSARDYAPFLLLSNAPSNNVYHPYPPEMKVYKYYEEFTDTVLLRELNTRNYAYLIYQVNSPLDSIFHQANVQQQISQNGFTTDSVYGNINYRIWSIKN